MADSTGDSTEPVALGSLDPTFLRVFGRQRPLRPYESLETTARQIFAGFKQIIEDQLLTGYTRDGFNIPSVYPPIDWYAHNRSYAFHLHAWDAITDLLTGFSTYGDARYLDAALAHAREWIEKFQLPQLPFDTAEALDALVRPKMPVEWYDMAVGQRCYRLAYLLDILSRRENTSDVELDIWWRALWFHLKLLNRPHFFRAHTNHGLYQALGHLAAAQRFYVLPGMPAEYALAKQRVLAVLAHHFSFEGPHKEHSPGYHYMLMGTLINARRCGLLNEGELAEKMTTIESAMPEMIKPDYCLATFGDTDPRRMIRGEKIAELYSNESFRFVISGGVLGTAPRSGVKAYHDAGYAFARLYAHDVAPVFGNASYLAQIAGFHSRVHKHADHLSFVWYDRGRDVLIDPARYAYAGRTAPGTPEFEEGFWYSDPKRIYCEATRAHNCVEIDGRSYQRNKVKPWGSALIYAGEQGGFAVTDCEVTHFRNVRHRRHLIMRAGHFLLVLDWLHDRSGIVHDYRQWFHFDHPWGVETDGCLIRARHPGADGSPPLDLTASSLVSGPTLGPVVRGQERPELLGWQSDKPYSLIPSSCFRHEVRGAGPTIFATLFTFGEKLEVDARATRFNASMKMGRAVWTDERGQHRIEIERSDDDRLTVREVPT